MQDSLVLHPGANVVLWNRLRVGFNLPIYAWQDGQSGALLGSTYNAPSENVGDLRLGADVRLYGTYEGPFTLAAGVQLFAPTGSRNDFTGDGITRAEPRAMVAGRAGMFVYAAKLAFDYRPLQDPFAGTALGSDFLFGASAGVRTWEERMVVGAEIFGSTIVNGSGAFQRDNTPLEVLIGSHMTVARDWRIGAGFGPGLRPAYGEPVVRVLLSAEWAPAFAKPAPPPPPTPPPPPPPTTEPPPPPPHLPRRLLLLRSRRPRPRRLPSRLLLPRLLLLRPIGTATASWTSRTRVLTIRGRRTRTRRRTGARWRRSSPAR